VHISMAAMLHDICFGCMNLYSSKHDPWIVLGLFFIPLRLLWGMPRFGCGCGLKLVDMVLLSFCFFIWRQHACLVYIACLGTATTQDVCLAV